MKKRLLSGIRVSGVTHIGNYFGAIKQWVEMQNDYENFTFLADLHAITTPYDPNQLKQKTLESVKLYVACGLDPKKTTIFVQSHIPAHAELTWILGTIARMGELSRMTQFKEKSQGKESANLGLFSYPVLMAADILLYRADVVPVGEDQKQHVELTRDLAQRFNKIFGQTFKIPDVQIRKEAARLMGLDNPAKKMSKSAENANNYISLLDSADTIRHKIKIAITDSGNEIVYDEANKPAISNLMTIYSLASGKSYKDIEKNFSGLGYREFKESLAETLVEFLTPIQEKYSSMSETEAMRILSEGREKANEVAQKIMNEVRQRIGLLSL